MCGINFSLYRDAYHKPNDHLIELLRSRGPDFVGCEQSQIDTNNGIQYYMTFTSSVLALRGEKIIHQPLRDSTNGSIFCWNGEAWKLGGESVRGNDGKAIFELLMRASSTQVDGEATLAILKVLRSISGPFAFVFLDQIHKTLYFGRDRLGRRSLLFRAGFEDFVLELCSISDPTSGPWLEVEADGIYQFSLINEPLSPPCLSFDSFHLLKSLIWLRRYSWVNSSSQSNDHLLSTRDRHTSDYAQREPSLGVFNSKIPSTEYLLDLGADSIETLHYLLYRSLALRVPQVPLLSGSEDTAHSRIAILFSGGVDCTVLARITHDILPFNQEIDLLNVAFENPRAVQAAKNAKLRKTDHKILDFTQDSPYEMCPDRITGRNSLKELQQVCPQRKWRFVAINVPFTETALHREIIIDLMCPHDTEMDLSIAFALYFASRGVGLASIESSMLPSEYKTPARVLLSGFGADELFGGYTRHSTAFNRKGFSGLLDELKLDFDRLGKRNLGRDDRVISHWGKEVRFPFLEEELVNWAIVTPISEKCGFGSVKSSETPGLGLQPEKLVLRLLSYKLGMVSAAMEKKRAIQFGARTAKMQSGKVKGTTSIR